MFVRYALLVKYARFVIMILIMIFVNCIRLRLLKNITFEENFAQSYDYYGVIFLI